MMEDWTDIIGEELENIEEPLPADDWSVLQQKYAAAQKRKKAAAIAWAGGFTSVAAAVVLVVLLSRPDVSNVNDDNLVADNLPPVEVVAPADSVAVESSEEPPVLPRKGSVHAAIVKKAVDDVLVADNQYVVDECSEEALQVQPEELFDVIRDTVSKTEVLLADASLTEGDKTDETVQPTGTLGFEDFPEEPQKRVRRPMSIGVSGAVSDSPVVKSYDRGYAEPPMGGEPPYTGDGGIGSPNDSTFTGSVKISKAVMMKTQRAYSDQYSHEIPVSAGISARFYLTDRLSINTGLNYTRYKSLRTRTFLSDNKRQKDWQYVHYLGVPVRLDWATVNRKHFNLYLGAGVQMDKCVYATVGEERLHEKQILFGINGTVGIQVNVIPMVGIYFEPDFSYALNEGSIETFRSDEPFTIAVRAGLRFNL